MKKIQLTVILFLSILCFSAGSSMAQYEPPKHVEKQTPFPWPNGKRCAISLTFDDARLSQVDVGIPLLNAYGIKATFYLSPSSLKRRIEGWKSAVADGHEIGNHSMTHPCTGNYSFSWRNALEEYTLDKIAADIDQANETLYDTLHVKAKSFAYPCGQTFVGRGKNLQSYVPLISAKFLTGRSWLSEGSNNPWFSDFSQLLGIESDGKSFHELKALADQAAKEGRWLILAGHEIGEKGRQTTQIASLKAFCQYAQDPANGIWIDTVGAVSEYIKKIRNEVRE